MNPILVQHLQPFYYQDVENQIKQLLYEILFQPLAAVINEYNPQLKETHKALENSVIDILREALRHGRIQYADGIFSGNFNAAIARALRSIGAAFDKCEGVYRLPVNRVPPWIMSTAMTYHTVARGVHLELERRLDAIQARFVRIVDDNPIDASVTVNHVDKGFEHISELLKVSPRLDKESRARLAVEYSDNMKLWIKKWTGEEIVKLREVVETNAEAGYRFDTLIDKIRNRYSVSANKAKFLARQETGLFMAKFREVRFSEAGVTRYQWSTAHDARVRPTAEARGRARLNDHRHLDGRTFAYKDPPIVDKATGRRANPGQDYNCRCVDIPVLEAYRPHQEAVR